VETLVARRGIAERRIVQPQPGQHMVLAELEKTQTRAVNNLRWVCLLAAGPDKLEEKTDMVYE